MLILYFMNTLHKLIIVLWNIKIVCLYWAFQNVRANPCRLPSSIFYVYSYHCFKRFIGYLFCRCQNIYKLFSFSKSGSRLFLKFDMSWKTNFCDKLWVSETNIFIDLKHSDTSSLLTEHCLRLPDLVNVSFSQKFSLPKKLTLWMTKYLDMYFALKSQMFMKGGIVRLLGRWKKVVEKNGAYVIS